MAVSTSYGGDFKVLLEKKKKNTQFRIKVFSAVKSIVLFYFYFLCLDMGLQ